MDLRVFLGHGASGNAAAMRPWVDGLRAQGYAADAIDLPVRKAEDAIPAFHAAVPRAPAVVVGGHSYGGRVASLAAAEPGAPYAALVLLSYPLHQPGKPDGWDARTSHWPQIRCPVLLLSGEADPLAKVDLLRRAVERLADAELVTYPGVRHGTRPVLDDVLVRIGAFLERVRGVSVSERR